MIFQMEGGMLVLFNCCLFDKKSSDYFECFIVCLFFLLWLSVRACLGLFVLHSFRDFCEQVTWKFGQDTAKYLVLITLSQFHFMFYMTRPLPNVFALAIGESLLRERIASLRFESYQAEMLQGCESWV